MRFYILFFLLITLVSCLEGGGNTEMEKGDKAVPEVTDLELNPPSSGDISFATFGTSKFQSVIHCEGESIRFDVIEMMDCSFAGEAEEEAESEGSRSCIAALLMTNDDFIYYFSDYHISFGSFGSIQVMFLYAGEEHQDVFQLGMNEGAVPSLLFIDSDGTVQEFDDLECGDLVTEFLWNDI